MELHLHAPNISEQTMTWSAGVEYNLPFAYHMLEVVCFYWRGLGFMWCRQSKHKVW